MSANVGEMWKCLEKSSVKKSKNTHNKNRHNINQIQIHTYKKNKNDKK